MTANLRNHSKLKARTNPNNTPLFIIVCQYYYHSSWSEGQLDSLKGSHSWSLVQVQLDVADIDSLKVVHSHVYQLGLLVGWGLRWDCQQELPHMDSLCSLGFLTAWQSSSKSKNLKKERARSKLHFSHDPQSHGVTAPTVHWSRQPQMSTKFQEEGHIPLPWMGKQQVGHTVRRACGLL